MTAPLIHAENIERELDTFRIGPFSLSLEPGLVYALVGPNGSGKTTLFRMLMGQVHPATGTILRFGQPLEVDNTDQTQRIAYVPEVLTGHDDWNMHEINELYRWVYPNFDSRLVQEYQRDIDQYQKFSALSKGMQRRAMLGTALASGADVLLLDEPTDGIDPFARQEVLGHVGRFMEADNRTVLMATHNLEDVRRIADVVIVIENGEHIGTWEKDELLEGWQKLWLASDPPGPVAGEMQRVHGAGVEVVTNDMASAGKDLTHMGIEILNQQPVDMVEALEVVIRQKRGRTLSAGKH